jgi:hypothetical protein
VDARNRCGFELGHEPETNAIPDPWVQWRRISVGFDSLNISKHVACGSSFKACHRERVYGFLKVMGPKPARSLTETTWCIV